MPPKPRAPVTPPQPQQLHPSTGRHRLPAPKPAGSNGSSSAAPAAPVAPAAPSAPAPDAWDPMVTQKSASNPFDSEPSTAAPAGAAPAKPSWLSSIDHGVSIASTIPPPDPGAWAPAAPTAPLSGKGSSEINPASFTPRSPAEISPASFAPKTPDLGVASPLVTGPTVDARLQPAAPAAPGQTLPATPASTPTSTAPTSRRAPEPLRPRRLQPRGTPCLHAKLRQLPAATPSGPQNKLATLPTASAG